jgi:hypothetical protein
MSEAPKTQFEQAAAERREVGVVTELAQFLRHNKRWWMLPLILLLLGFGALTLLSGTAAAPFIYTLF